MAKIMLVCGPPGSGKSTFARKYAEEGFVYINQDAQGRKHLELFEQAIKEGKDVVVDRLNFSKQQRDRYLVPAKAAGYETAISVFHQPYSVCLERCLNRKGHETIVDESNAKSALNMFFSKYERVQDDEADTVQRFWPDGDKPSALIIDLDGTLCDCTHRLHHVKRTDGSKKNWKAFFDGMSEDTVNKWCKEIIHALSGTHCVVLCSGRPDNYRKETIEWLKNNEVSYDDLFMRNRSDQRQDSIIKEILLDFEILTRYRPHFFIDDRPSVCRMWRSRDMVVLQCNDREF